ncbi:MAG: response regulator [bacterium]
MNNPPAQILVVDDDMMARMEVAQCVRNLGHIVTMSSDGASAMELLRSKAFDLVLLDLIMPDMDGFEVLRQIKLDDGLSSILVVVVSGTEEGESIAKCIEMGAIGHIAKPIDPGQFKSVLEKCLSQ